MYVCMYVCMYQNKIFSIAQFKKSARIDKNHIGIFFVVLGKKCLLLTKPNTLLPNLCPELFWIKSAQPYFVEEHLLPLFQWVPYTYQVKLIFGLNNNHT